MAETDAARVQKLRSDIDAMRYLDRPKTQTIEQAIQKLRRLQQEMANEESFGWKICLKGTRELIGTIGLHRMRKESFRTEIGYMLMPEYWRQGLMMEALEAAISFAFTEMGFHTIEADINPENDASRKLLLRLGFQKEAYLRENFFFEGRFLDSEIYGLINPHH